MPETENKSEAISMFETYLKTQIVRCDIIPNMGADVFISIERDRMSDLSNIINAIETQAEGYGFKKGYTMRSGDGLSAFVPFFYVG